MTGVILGGDGIWEREQKTVHIPGNSIRSDNRAEKGAVPGNGIWE